MDVLSDVLEKMKLSSAVYFKSDFSSPWGMDVTAGSFAQFHIVVEGQCILETANDSIILFAGDIVVFPFGTSHCLLDAKTSEKVPGLKVVESILAGNSIFKGESHTTSLVCGHFEFDKNLDHSFIKSLPDLIHIAASEKDERVWLTAVSDLIIYETGRGGAGSRLIVKKLGEVLFTHTLRAYMQTKAGDSGFMAALQDRRISNALIAIHENPQKYWNLVSLAEKAGMSRTAFSVRFKALLGETPLHYLTQWRIIQAKEWLEVTDKSVGEIAENVGYRSEAAFNRVFKKRVLLTPLKYRQHQNL